MSGQFNHADIEAQEELNRRLKERGIKAEQDAIDNKAELSTRITRLEQDFIGHQKQQVRTVDKHIAALEKNVDDQAARLVKCEEALAWFQRNAVRMPLPRDHRLEPEFDPDSESEAERVGVLEY